jgi:hypothetical protein
MLVVMDPWILIYTERDLVKNIQSVHYLLDFKIELKQSFILT